MAAGPTLGVLPLNWSFQLTMFDGQRPATRFDWLSVSRDQSLNFLMDGSEFQQPRSIGLQNPIRFRTIASVAVDKVVGRQNLAASNCEQSSLAKGPNVSAVIDDEV